MGHYSQQRGTKETNNGLMKGDRVAKPMRAKRQPRARVQLPNMRLNEREEMYVQASQFVTETGNPV